MRDEDREGRDLSKKMRIGLAADRMVKAHSRGKRAALI
jgi:hypothetical protein